MLELKNISKTYELGKKKDKNYQIVHALKKVSVNFRQSEFVSILGQSGCGKTTLLNIIGGLDKYSSGDLVIDGKSTKKYSDKDWDDYRNHKIGFVFQSYNLIPHLTVFENVELALTLSGISKNERKTKVVKTLNKVGLGDKINAKPNQLSGGQMQRVAIARALINDPEIILADEPTGALDSKTSVQIMEILKEISKEKLIIMVTHNPELAENYSSRIIKLFDGEIIDDNKPYVIENVSKTESIPQTKTKRARMSFWTALSLSFKNLLTKKTRTLLVSFAGSIGIIGIALILALSSGFQSYINDVQRTTLTAYPLEIERSYTDYSSLLNIMDEKTEPNTKTDKVYSNAQLEKILQTMGTFMTTSTSKQNKLDPFIDFVKTNNDLKNYVNEISYTYDYKFNLYTNSAYTGTTKVSPNSVFEKSFGAMYNAKLFESYEYDAFGALYNNVNFLQSQYTLVSGEWPVNSDGEFETGSYNQVVLMLDNNNQINDYFLYALGLKNQNNLPLMMQKMQDPTVTLLEDATSFNYSDLVGKTFSLVSGDKYYTENGGTYDYFNDKTASQTDLNNFITTNKALDLEIVGIVKANTSDVANANEFAVGFTSQLYSYLSNLISTNTPSIITAQLASPTTNILTNAPFAVGESLKANLKEFGHIDITKPDGVKFFAKDFETKEQIITIINNYNNDVKNDTTKGEAYEIHYNDYVGMLMSNVSTIINAITYVLIAFVSVSLIVSSIMIGIITYISVLERIKEIGVLRSIGASKRDIKRVFTAESIIIGGTAGAVGILITLVMCIPINIIISSLASLNNIASLPLLGGTILILLSVLLTFIAGLIPAKIASKKDPVVALRTE